MNFLEVLLQRNRALAAQQALSGSRLPSLPEALPHQGHHYQLRRHACGSCRCIGSQAGRGRGLAKYRWSSHPRLVGGVGLLGRIGQVASDGGEFHLIVLQHTDCGITRLVNDATRLARYLQIPVAELETKSVTDPYTAVRIDAAALGANPALQGEWLLSGLVYAVITALMEVVVPAAPIRRP